MRLTRAAPAEATSSLTPPISREVAFLIGASRTSAAARIARLTGFRRAVFAGRAARRVAFFAFFDFLAMPRVVAQNARMTKALAVTLLMLAASVPGGAQSPPVIGSWKLVSYTTETADGTRTFPLGEDAVGLALYLANGRVSIQFMKRDRPRFQSGDAWRGTLEEERAAFEGYFAYAGRYTLDETRATVTHHIEISSVPNYVGIDLPRTFAIAGRRLTLRTPPRMLAGQTSTSTLVWERLD